MKTQNSNLLKLSYNLNKGLMLNWSFKGEIMKETYFKHILILDCKNTDFLRDFVKDYYKRIKCGDLIALVKYNSIPKPANLRWKQKQFGTQLNLKKISSEFQTQECIIQKLNLIGEQLQQYQQPIIVNIFTDKKDVKAIYESVLSIRKNLKTLDFIVTFFGDFANQISYTTGMNKLNYCNYSKEKVLAYYHNKYISKIQLLYVKITITCQNGSLNCQKSDQWENPQFSSLVKTFYAPHSDYGYDSLFMINQNGLEAMTYQLKIALQYETFGRRKFQSIKNISLNLQNQKIYLRTFAQREQVYETQIQPGIWTMKNVYSSNCFLWFNKERQTNAI